MNLVLIGYRGTGKSEVGARLAARLGMPVLSMDALIVERAGKPVPEIVAERGWPGFRDLETEIARECAARDGVIIDCGGGVIERWENIEVLGEHGVIVWLSASVDTIVRRIQGDTQRPSLTGAQSFTDEVAEVLTRRTPLYQAAADAVVETDALTPAEVAARIVEIWEQATKPGEPEGD
jgi:shikimate kinase